MGLRNTDRAYGIVSKLLHWLLLIFLLGAVIGGNLDAAMADGPEKDEALAMHRSFGVLIIMLVMLRLFWRLINPVPIPAANVSKVKQRLAYCMHWALYALMLSQPIIGIAMVQSYGYDVSFFGVFDVPMLFAEHEGFGEVFHLLHEYVWIALAAFVVGHAGVALHHHFTLKDNVLRRMIFGADNASG